MINFALIIVAGFLGILSILSPKKGLAAFLVTVAVLPLNYLIDIELSVLSFFRVYILTALSSLIFFCLAKSIRLELHKVIVLLMFFVVYFISYLFSDNVGNGVLFKDLHSLSIFFAVCILTAYFKDNYRVNIITAKRVLYLALIVDVFLYLIIRVYGLAPEGSRGQFFLRTGVLRYSDILTITLFSFSSMLYFLQQGKGSGQYLLLMIIISVLSFDRVFLLWTLFISLDFILKFSKRNVVFSSVVFLAFSFLMTFIFYRGSLPILESQEVLYRFKELVTVELLVDALYFRFVQPAVDGGYLLTVKTFFLGDGPGFLFNIPWFAYRGLDAFQVSTDSFVFANFFKYGIVGVSLLGYLIYKFVPRKHVKANAWLIPYLIVHNGVLVDNFLMYLLFLSVLQIEKPKELNAS